VTARDLALFELDQRRLPGWPHNELRSPHRDAPTDPRDLALAEQILVGVIKNHFFLQHLIEHYSGRKLKRIDTLVQKILSVALYQLHFLDRIPSSAAVNEAVNQAKRFGRTKAAGFVNAVLRKAASAPSPPGTPGGEGTRDFAQTFLSHPRDLFDRLQKLLGTEDALRFCEHDNREPPTIVRLSPGIAPSQLESPGVALTPHEHPGMFIVEPAKKSLLADWSRRGLAQVQDPTAADVVEHGQIQPGQSILDRCAGLGTKTMQLLEKVGGTGSIVAMDPSADRCRILRSLLAERNIANVAVHQAAMLANEPELAARQFDLALVDVPCGNSGVLARRPEARYAQTAAALDSLAKLQISILDDTAPHIRPGGLLVYSTCNIWPEENQAQVDRFLERHPEFSRQAEQITLPSLSLDTAKYHDGGYWALLRCNLPVAGRLLN
jgi:16S rRNA (cytosine967-C5)-methyltransferase